MEGPQFSTLQNPICRSWKVDVIGMINMPKQNYKRSRN